jgi:archaellum biogenesis ATPase FlaH
MKIEVNVPKYLDLDHTYQAVMDALYNADNVSKQEVLLVSSMLNQLAYNKSKGILKHGFRDWAETHHEIVCTIHAFITNDTMPTRLLDIIDEEGMAGLYDLGIDLTNEFENTYAGRVWDGDWVDTIIEFVNAKLK